MPKSTYISGPFLVEFRSIFNSSGTRTGFLLLDFGTTALKKPLLTVLKLLIPVGIFGYLLWSVPAEDYQTFWNQPKRWERLLLAQAIGLTAILISFARWHALVRAFEIPFQFREALRLGFLGYLLNFVSFGSVGGDVFKAILVAKNKPEKRPEAVASVLLDRAIGLLGLVILASSCLFLFPKEPLSNLMRGIRDAGLFVAIASVTALLVCIYAGKWFERFVDLIERIPVAGGFIARMARAVRLLRGHPMTIVLVAVYAIGVHSLLAFALFLISAGTYREYPTLGEHMMVVPPAMAAGTLPLAPGGIGYQEGALAGLFQQLPQIPDGFSGILVATIYRLITLVIAGIGLIYYFASHGRELTREAEAENAHSESAVPAESPRKDT